jgi:hypothetical protein
LLDVSRLSALFDIQERLEDVILDAEGAQRITVVGDMLP